MNERDDFELKRDLDQLPRSIEPPADLWPAVRGRLKDRGSVGAWERGSVWWRKPQNLRIAALLGLLAVSGAALAITRRDAATWRVAAADGTTRIFTVGESLSTGLDSARVTVGRIGHLDLAVGTDVRLLEARISSQRLALARGRVHAEISAPPRLFIIETPSGTAVDLGCAYTLEVDSAGTSTIVVTAGWVSFEDGAARSLIPAGMRAVSRRGAGIGTPVLENADPALTDAVRAFDASRSDSALGAVLRSTRTRDAVTLWHLVQKTGDKSQQRERLVTKLTAMVPLPSGVTRAAIERNDPHAMELYWTVLPGTLPIVPSWQQALWKLWLRMAG